MGVLVDRFEEHEGPSVDFGGFQMMHPMLKLIQVPSVE